MTNDIGEIVTTERFDVYSTNEFQDSFESLESAIEYAESLPSDSVRSTGKEDIYWDNFNTYVVHQHGRYIGDFETFKDSVSYARNYEGASVLFQDFMEPVWVNSALPPTSDLLDAPMINQMPELPRGCEVTSLAMLLRHAGLDVDKLTLAEEIRKDTTPYQRKNGVIYFGNPYDGFVGDMYSFDNPGYGVYHGPIAELAERHLPGQIMDLTGVEFEDILQSLNRGAPVWIIQNSWFAMLPQEQFQTWETPGGPVEVTYRLHSVLSLRDTTKTLFMLMIHWRI